MCARDEEGSFVLAKTMNFPDVHAVDAGEALGLYHTLEWLSGMHFDNVDFEVDSKTTQMAFYTRKDDVYEFGMLLKHVAAFFPQDSQTLGWSLFGDKQMRLLMSWQERPHY
jgi:hypothetical protein